MSSVVADAPRARRGAIAIRSVLAAERTALTALGLVTGLLVAITWQTWGDIGQDTGYDLVAGAFVAHGHMPYVDFTYYYGAGAPLLGGLVAFLGGTGLAPAVALGVVLTVAIVVATYLLARTQVAPWGAFAAAAIIAPVAFAPTNLSYVLPHSLSASLAVLVTLGFCIAATRYAATRASRWLVATGIFAGLVSLTRPEFEAAVLAAAAVWLFLRRRAGVGSRREIAIVGGLACAVPAIVYGAFVAAGVSVHALLFDNLYPVRVLHAGGNAILRTQAPLTVGSILHVVAKALAYGVGVAGLVALGGLAMSRSRVGKALAIGAAAVAAAAAGFDLEAARTGLQYAYGWIPVGAVVLVAVLFLRRLRSRSAWQPSAQGHLVIAVVLAVLAAKTYAAFYFESSVTQPAVYAAPFAAVLLVRFHLRDLAGRRGAVLAGAVWLAFLAAVGVGLTAKDAHGKSATLSGPGGSIAVTPSDAALYGSALAAIDAHSRPGDPVLIAPQLTLLYTLSGRTDPLNDISLLPGAPGDVAAERAAIARLERERVHLAIVDRVRLSEYGHGSFGSSYDTTLGAWIRRDFRRVATLTAPGGRSKHQLDVLVRRSS